MEQQQPNHHHRTDSSQSHRVYGLIGFYLRQTFFLNYAVVKFSSHVGFLLYVMHHDKETMFSNWIIVANSVPGMATEPTVKIQRRHYLTNASHYFSVS